MPTALGLAAERSFVPGDYHNPHLLTNLCLVVVAGAFFVLKTLGVTPTLQAFGTFVWNHTFVFLLLARWISAAFGAGSVAITYAIARRLAGATAAVLAAWSLAVCFVHVRDSHFSTNDVLMTFFVAATVLQSIRYMDDPSSRTIALAGAMLGLAIGSKYNAGVAIFSLVAAVVFTAVERPILARGRDLIIGGTATVAGFAASNPAVLWRPGHVLNGFRVAGSMDQAFFSGMSSRPVSVQMLEALELGFGAVAVLFAIWGTYLLWQRAPRLLAVVAATPAALVLVTLEKQIFFPRFILLALPLVAVLVGAGAGDAFSRIGRWPFSRRAMSAVVLLALLCEPLARSLYFDAVFTRLDNRRDVEAWLRARPGALESSVLDGLTATAFASPLPDGTRVITNPEMASADPSKFVPAETRYVVLSTAGLRPEFARLYRLCQSRGRVVMESSPYRSSATADDVEDTFAPYRHVFQWARPGMVTRVFELQPGAPSAAR